jgi:hypothetical protein
MLLWYLFERSRFIQFLIRKIQFLLTEETHNPALYLGFSIDG